MWLFHITSSIWFWIVFCVLVKRLVFCNGSSCMFCFHTMQSKLVRSVHVRVSTAHYVVIILFLRVLFFLSRIERAIVLGAINFVVCACCYVFIYVIGLKVSQLLLSAPWGFKLILFICWFKEEISGLLIVFSCWLFGRMALQTAIPSAQVVANAFIAQYYHILHHNPGHVYRFYQDSSVLSRPDSDGVMRSVTTMQVSFSQVIFLFCSVVDSGVLLGSTFVKKLHLNKQTLLVIM